MINKFIFLALIAFTIYKTIIFYKHVFKNKKETAGVTRTYSDKIGSNLIDLFYLLTYLCALFAWYKSGFNTFLMVVGFGFVLYAWYVRLIALKDLDKSYGHEIKLFENHKLITTGIYDKVRHPLYAGLILDLIGIAIMSQFIWTWIFCLGFIIVVLRRINLEDKKLIEKIGEEAVRYQKRVQPYNIFQKF